MHIRMSVFMDIPKSNYAVSYERLFQSSATATAILLDKKLNEETCIFVFSVYHIDTVSRRTA